MVVYLVFSHLVVNKSAVLLLDNGHIKEYASIIGRGHVGPTRIKEGTTMEDLSTYYDLFSIEAGEAAERTGGVNAWLWIYEATNPAKLALRTFEVLHFPEHFGLPPHSKDMIWGVILTARGQYDMFSEWDMQPAA
jgi:hypothetical protein